MSHPDQSQKCFGERTEGETGAVKDTEEGGSPGTHDKVSAVWVGLGLRGRGLLDQ